MSPVIGPVSCNKSVVLMLVVIGRRWLWCDQCMAIAGVQMISSIPLNISFAPSK